MPEKKLGPQIIPGIPARQQGPPGEFSTDFGFGKQVQKQQDTPLDQAYSQWNKNQTPLRLRELLGAANSVINRAVVSYAGGDRAMTSRAKRLAIAAFKNYDPERGTKLQTHLMIRLQPLQREYMKRVSPVSVPERVQLDKYRLDKAEEEFKALYGREASDDELSATTNMSSKRLARLRMFNRGAVSEGQMMKPETGSTLPGSQELGAEDIWLEYVHHDLDAIDQKIMEWKMGYNGKSMISTNEIARRLGITPGAVSQRASKIAMKIEEGQQP